MFTSVAQDALALSPTEYSEELIKVLSQLANCAATLEHHGPLVVDYDGNYFSTSTAEQFHTFDNDPITLPNAGGIFVNPNGNAVNAEGVIMHRPNEAGVAMVVDGDMEIDDLLVTGSILGGDGEFAVGGITWTPGGTPGDVSTPGFDFILTDPDSAARVAGCYDTYAADCSSAINPFTAYGDLINLRRDFTIGFRFKPVFASPPSVAVVDFYSYREAVNVSARTSVYLYGEIALYGSLYKMKMHAAVVPAKTNPTGSAVPARVGREYVSNSCLSVFMRWKQSTKTMTLNVLRPGETGGDDTNDTLALDVADGTYILSDGSDKRMIIQGGDGTVARFYWDRMTIWNHHLSDGQVRYEFLV